MGQAHPKVRLVIGDGTSATLQPHLASGSLDAAVVNLPQSNPDMVERPLFDEDLVLIVPNDHRLAARPQVSLADLDGIELLLPAPGTVFRTEIDEACRVADVALRPRVEVDGVRLIASLALQGYGPAILPATGAGDGLSGFARVSVAGLPRRRVGVVRRRRGRPSAPARAMLETLDAMVAANLDPARGVHAPSE
jgi:DNA-binding transcriptional LysR family regulator